MAWPMPTRPRAYAAVLPASELRAASEDALRSSLPARRSRVVGSVAAWSALLLAATAVAGWTASRRAHAGSTSLRAGAPRLESKAELDESGSEVRAACEIDEGVFFPGNDLEKLSAISGAEECCERCRIHEKCLAWSWGKAWSDLHASVCFLKGAAPRPLTKVSAADFVSGQTHQLEKQGAPLEVKTPAQGQSLFCFSLVQGEGYERDLIALQFQLEASIFACDEYALYSDRRFLAAPAVWAGVINSTLHCDTGGEFGTALNTGIFLALWAKIVFDGRFIYHDWTVKADPDAVFLPNRLRSHLLNHMEEARGVYINNCKYGLHGPLEVFSRNAVKAWALGATECVTYFTHLCSGPCGWGEDMFIDQCLEKKLDVRRDDDFRLLLEDHCDPPKNWDDCSNTTVASFHPFKTKDGWMTCLARANEFDRRGSLTFKQ